MSDWRIDEGSRYPVTLTLGGADHRMTVARAMALVAGAPKMAGAWHAVPSDEPTLTRRDGRDTPLAYVHRGGREQLWWWRAFSGAMQGGPCATLDEAKAAADAALRAAGWVLDDGGSDG